MTEVIINRHFNNLLTLSASIVLFLEMSSKYFCSKSRNFISTMLSGFSKKFFRSSRAAKKYTVNESLCT